MSTPYAEVICLTYFFGRPNWPSNAAHPDRVTSRRNTRTSKSLMCRSSVLVGSLHKQNQKRPTKLVVLTIIYVAIALSITGIWCALHKSTMLVASSQNGSRSTLLVLLGVVTVLTIAAPAGLVERRRAEERELFPLANGPLTEPENRRELFYSLEMEIKRSNRSQRPFAFLRIQIDDLNRINRERGQLVCDKAICQLAHVLQSHCRELDVVVRYGVDEFAIVIPEAGPETVYKVTRRIRERLADDHKLPPFSIRIGAAMFGEDGKSIDTLVEAADRDLYDVKRIAEPETSLCA
jgi:diguanylate cyclase (GGDEF)-like protein